MAVALLEPILARVITFFGFAGAAREVVAPFVNELEQDIWQGNPTMALDAVVAAQLDAQGIDPGGAWSGDAAKKGIADRRYEALVKLNQGPPQIGQVFDLWRRSYLTKNDVLYALRRLGIEERFHGPIMDLQYDRLSPADIANAIQQGFMTNPGVLPTSPSTAAGKVPHSAPVSLDPLKEAEAHGVDKTRLSVLARLAGLPPGPETLLTMLRRGIIAEPDVERGIAEGHTKTEWTAAYLALRTAPLSAAELANLVIREWLTLDDAIEQAKRVGIDEHHFRLMVQGTGRPPGPVQLMQAVNRGLIDRPRFEKGIAESDVRPEWADTLYALRVRYPTTFALRQLVTSGAIDAGEAARILRLEGWEPALAAKVTTAWAANKATKLKELSEAQIATLYEARYIDRGQAEALLGSLGFHGHEVTYLLELADARRVTRFLNTAVGRLHTLFVSHRLSEQHAVSGLHELSISAQATDDLMAMWKLERDANKPAISPAQIAAAVHYQIISHDEGVTMLVDRGYTDHDARFVIAVRQHAAEPGEHL